MEWPSPQIHLKLCFSTTFSVIDFLLCLLEKQFRFFSFHLMLFSALKGLTKDNKSKITFIWHYHLCYTVPRSSKKCCLSDVCRCYIMMSVAIGIILNSYEIEKSLPQYFYCIKLYGLSVY